MHSKNIKTISVVLALGLIASSLSGCGIAGQSSIESAETSLPTTSATTRPETETTVTTETTESETTVTETEVVEETFATAIDNYDIDPEYVTLFDGVTPEMMKSDFWVGENDNIVLMDRDEIAVFNYNNRTQFKSDNGTPMPRLDVFEDTLDGNILKEFLNDNADSVPDDPSLYYLNGHKVSRGYWMNLVELSNIDGVEDEIRVRYGFTVKRMTLRLFPTEDRVFKGKDEQYFDFILYSECMPVVVLHESLDGEYLYVVFDSFSAWVRKDAVALCNSRDEWEARQSPEQWLVVTAREIRLGDDPYNPAIKDLVLPMGTRMSLVSAEDTPSVINQRTTYGNYVVKVPTRGSDGYIKDEYVLIPVSDDVHVGFLSLTPANIVTQAMKLLGDRYGWGGDLRANDCTGITREIYRCFGILLPRVGQSDSKGICKVDLSEMSTDEKLNVITNLSPGSLVSFPGHMMIYLGTVDGVPYVISSVGSLTAQGSTTRQHPDSVIINSLYVKRANGTTWLDSVQTALTIRPE